MKRLNTKFIIVLAAFLTVAIGGVAIVYAYNMIKDPTRNVRQGQELERIGDYRGASKAYGRAVAKRRSNIEYMDMMRAATLKIVPETVEEARQHYETVLALLRQRARPNPSDPEPWRLLLNAVEERARFLQDTSAWQLLFDTAKDMASAVPPGGEPERRALVAQGYALAQGDLDLASSEKEAVESGLRRVLEQDPTNEQAWDALLTIIIHDAADLLLANQVVRGQQRLQEFNDAMAAAEAAIPESAVLPMISLRRIRTDLERRAISFAEARTAMRPVLDRLEAHALSDGASQMLVIRTADQLMTMGDQDDTRRAVAILDHWLGGHPDDVVAKRLRAIALRMVDFDRAEKELQELLDAPPRTVSLEAAFRDELRADAAERLFDLQIARAEMTQDPAERERHVAAARTLRDRMLELSRGRAEEPMVLRADAVLALLDQKYLAANTLIDRLLAVARSPRVEVYLIGAQAAMARNELGLALSYINRGIEALGGQYALMLAKARVELMLRRGSDAMRTATAILSIQPDDAAAKAILADAQLVAGSPLLRDEKNPLLRSLIEIDRLMVEKQIDEARRLVKELAARNPPDARILAQGARVEIAAGNIPEAILLLDQALALSPNDGYLMQLRAAAETTDPLERTAKLADLASEDPNLRAVIRFTLTTMLVANLKQDLARGGRGSDGRLRDPELLRQYLAEAEAALPAIRDAAIAAAPTDRMVLAAQFDEALMHGDLERARAIGVEAEQAGHEVFGTLFQARALTLQRRFDDAIAVLERARQKGVQSAELSRQLGETREAMGMVSEALAAYKDAFDRRPSDRSVLERYADLARRSGDVQRALALYRDAAATGLADQVVINTWLRLEDLYGDRAQALCWRRRIFRDFPGDRENALALASILIDRRFDPRLIIEADCRPRYTPSEWEALPAAQKQSESAALLQAHAAEAEQIFTRLLQQNPNDFEVVLLQATALARARRLDEGVRNLRAMVDRAEPRNRGPLLFALGRFLDDEGRLSEALEVFEESKKYQDPTKREAELAISDHWFERGQWQRSYDALKPVVDANEAAIDRPRALRMAEICLRLRRFDEAKRMLDRVAAQSTGGADAQLELLRGNLQVGLGDDAWARGDRSAAEAAFRSAAASYQAAAAATPGSALPWISLATLHGSAFERSKDAKELDQALEFVNRCLQVSSGYWPAVKLKSELLMQKDDLTGSIQVLERFLELAPESVDARRILVERYLRGGNVTRALAVLSAGASLDPADTVWNRAIGELQIQRGNFMEATRAFDRALENVPSEQALAKSLEARVRRPSPDWDGIIELAQKYPNEMRNSPSSQAVLAAALVRTGDRENGIEALRRAGRLIRSGLGSGAASVDDLDTWYRATREVFPRGRTDELETFVTDLFGAGLGPEDHRWLAGLWVELGKDGISRARPHLEKAVAHLEAADARYRARVYLTVGNIAYLEDDCSGAIDAFERAVEADPGDPSALNNLAFLLAKCRDDFTRALEMAQRAVRQNNMNPWYLDTLGYLQIKTGDPDSAIVTLMRAVSIEPMAISLLHLAQAYHATGRLKEAREALDRAGQLQADEQTRQQIEALRKTLG